MRTIAAIFFVAAVGVADVHADDQLLVAGTLIDSSIAAPLLEWRAERTDGRSYRLSLSGWTVRGEWQNRALVLSAEATPIHAHNSNLIYRDGERANDLSYHDAAYRLRAGGRFLETSRSAADASLVAIYERISGVDDPGVVAAWRHPYYGVEAGHKFSITTARNPLIAAFDGVETSVRGESLFGRHDWSRIRLSETAARTLGDFHLRQSVTVVTGRSLNIVNRFLVGGSWDALGGDAVYGSRYGEYRVARAMIVSGGADRLFPRNWRIGIRGTLLRSDAADTWGHALNASTTWRTFGFNFGVGIPKKGSAVAYASIVAPLYRK